MCPWSFHCMFIWYLYRFLLIPTCCLWGKSHDCQNKRFPSARVPTCERFPSFKTRVGQDVAWHVSFSNRQEFFCVCGRLNCYFRSVLSKHKMCVLMSHETFVWDLTNLQIYFSPWFGFRAYMALIGVNKIYFRYIRNNTLTTERLGCATSKTYLR